MMKFKVFCSINENKKYYFMKSADGNIFIINVLLGDDFDLNTLGINMFHEFILVVNKHGQLTCLCIK